MQLTSPAFQHLQPIPVLYTCLGKNIHPPFDILDAPAATVSFVLVVEDIDAPNHWKHWLIYNMPAQVSHIPEGVVPDGTRQGICNGGTYGYEGPCPRYFQGEHRYGFFLYALDISLQVDEQADTPLIRQAMTGHVLAEAVLMGTATGILNA